MKKLKRFKIDPFTFCLCILSSLVIFIEPPVLLAGPPNVVLSQAIQFPTVDGKSVWLSPGKYLVEQAGPTELRLTSDPNNKEFFIKAEAFNHEQYELFSAMALTRPQKNHEYLIELFLPGGVRLKARGRRQELLTSPSLKEEPTISQIGSPSLEEPQVTQQAPPPLTEEPEVSQGVTIPLLPENSIPPENLQVAQITPDPEPPTPLPNPQIQDQISPSTMSQPPALISYQAPYPDQPGLRIDGVNADAPSVFTLTPNHVGHTSQKHPVFHWYLSQNSNYPLDFMIAEEGNSENLLDIQLLPPIQAGFHELRLKDYGLSLVPNIPYRWTIQILAPKTLEISIASGAIKRIETSIGSSPFLTSSPQDYAQKGLWYDALTTLNLLIQANFGNTELLSQRVSLLKQVGLNEVATFEQPAKTP